VGLQLNADERKPSWFKFIDQELFCKGQQILSLTMHGTIFWSEKYFLFKKWGDSFIGTNGNLRAGKRYEDK